MSLVILAADKTHATMLGDCINGEHADPNHPKVFKGPGGTLFGQCGYARDDDNIRLLFSIAQEMGISKAMTWEQSGALLERWGSTLGPHLYSFAKFEMSTEAILCGTFPNGRVWIRHYIYFYNPARFLKAASSHFPINLTLYAIGMCDVFKQEMNGAKGWHERPHESPDEIPRPFFIHSGKGRKPVGWAIAAHIATLSLQQGLPIAAPFHTVTL